MPRPIDADALMGQLEKKRSAPGKQRYTEGFNDALMRFRSMIHSAPTIEADPVRHGRWALTEYEYLDCSVCGKAYYTGCESLAVAKEHFENAPLYNFCPNCGAKMDGGTANA